MLLFQYVMVIWVQKCLKCQKYGSKNAETAKNVLDTSIENARKKVTRHSEIKIKAKTQGETKNFKKKSHDSVYIISNS